MRALYLAGIVWLTSAACAAADSQPAAPALAAPGLPQLRGVLALGRERQFSLVPASGGGASWLKVGDSIDGWKLEKFEPAEDTLILSRDGKNHSLRLSGSSITDAPVEAVRATVADAEALLQKMDFDRMMTRLLEQQRAGMERLSRQMTGGKDLPPEALEMQKRVRDMMFDSLKEASIKEDMVKLYSELFTQDQLRSMTEFYGTPAGQALIDKQPEIAQRMNELMMQRMVPLMSKIRDMQADFMKQQREKAAAAGKAPK